MRFCSRVAVPGAQASAALHARLQARLARQLAAFETAALASSLHVPVGLLLPGAAPAEPSPADPAAEAAVDAELAALAADLSQVPALPRPACRALPMQRICLRGSAMPVNVCGNRQAQQGWSTIAVEPATLLV